MSDSTISRERAAIRRIFRRVPREEHSDLVHAALSDREKDGLLQFLRESTDFQAWLDEFGRSDGLNSDIDKLTSVLCLDRLTVFRKATDRVTNRHVRRLRRWRRIRRVYTAYRLALQVVRPSFQQLETAESIHTINSTLKKMSRQEREVYRLRIVEGYTLKKTAETVDLSVNVVTRMLARVLVIISKAVDGQAQKT